MGNLGMPELMLILVLALLLFGPKRLPEVGKQVGKALGEFRRASNDLKRTIEDEMDKATRETPQPAEPTVAVAVSAPIEPGGAAPTTPAAQPRTDAPTPS
jgi:TatA/E family protein of Tat protein translocase